MVDPAAPSRLPRKKLVVGTRLVAPFVMEREGTLTGFSIELWERIRGRLGLEAEYRVVTTVDSLLDAVQSREVDAAVAAVSITSERELRNDFSQPIFASGLQILVRTESVGTPGILTTLFSAGYLQLLLLLLGLTLLGAHLVYFAERRHPDGLLAESRRYLPGILRACWWSAGTLATQADDMPRSPLGRLIAVVWMFIGVAFVAYYTAVITTNLTVQQLQGSIRGPEDLPGKRVAAVSGSTSEAYLKQHRISVIGQQSVDAAIQALLNRRVEAVVYDSPVLLHYAANAGRGKVHTTGPIFKKEDYGIVLPTGSPYRKAINRALLALRESGEYEEIYRRWFDEGSR